MNATRLVRGVTSAFILTQVRAACSRPFQPWEKARKTLAWFLNAFAVAAAAFWPLALGPVVALVVGVKVAVALAVGVFAAVALPTPVVPFPPPSA